MDSSQALEARIAEAKSVIESCIGNSGIWASSDVEDKTNSGYRGLIYLRDFAKGAIYGALAIGREDLVLKNLSNIKLKEDGSAPTYFIDEGFNWTADKIRRLKEDPLRKIVPYAWKFLMARMGKLSPHSHTPWSTDPTLHYINAIITYAEQTGNREILDAYGDDIEHALRFVKTQVDDVLYRGGDWRDNMRFKKGVALLSNNALLFRIYESLGYHEKADLLKKTIQERFWRDSYHADHPDTDHFDTSGQALIVVHGVADKNQYSGIASKFREMETEFGINANDYNLSEMSLMARWRNKKVNQCSTLWEWAMAEAILALKIMGEDEFAIRVYNKWTALKQFREYRNPLTGEGKGAINFMASAGLYLRVGQE